MGHAGEMPAFVLNDPEVFRSHAEHGRAIDLGLASDEISLLGMQVFSVLVLPSLFGVIPVVNKDRVAYPS